MYPNLPSWLKEFQAIRKQSLEGSLAALVDVNTGSRKYEKGTGSIKESSLLLL